MDIVSPTGGAPRTTTTEWWWWADGPYQRVYAVITSACKSGNLQNTVYNSALFLFIFFGLTRVTFLLLPLRTITKNNQPVYPLSNEQVSFKECLTRNKKLWHLFCVIKNTKLKFKFSHKQLVLVTAPVSTGLSFQFLHLRVKAMLTTFRFHIHISVLCICNDNYPAMSKHLQVFQTNSPTR